MEKWYNEAESNAMPGAIMYLVGSKLDKVSSRAVRYEEGERLAANHGGMFCEVSAKTRENIRKPFVEIVDMIVQSQRLTESFRRRSGGNIIIGVPDPHASGCGC